jgi:hypothetical protein
MSIGKKGLGGQGKGIGDFPYFSGDMVYKLSIFCHHSEEQGKPVLERSEGKNLVVYGSTGDSSLRSDLSLNRVKE